jgi:hypothetical protein
MNYINNYKEYSVYVKQLILDEKRPHNKNEWRRWKKYGDTRYFEFHHIIPECLGGDESEENYIPLTGREHFLAHYLLCKIYENKKNIYFKMLNAFLLMQVISPTQKLRYINTKLICKRKEDYNKALSEKLKNENDKTYENFKKYLNTPHYTTLGKKAYNNGKKIIMLSDNKEIPAGFKKGSISNENSLNGLRMGYEKWLKENKTAQEIRRKKISEKAKARKSKLRGTGQFSNFVITCIELNETKSFKEWRDDSRFDARRIGEVATGKRQHHKQFHFKIQNYS